MTTNELLQRVEQMNQQSSNNIQFNNSNGVAPGAYHLEVSDAQVELVDELLANIFTRGGY